jgi:hypothetical protein
MAATQADITRCFFFRNIATVRGRGEDVASGGGIFLDSSVRSFNALACRFSQNFAGGTDGTNKQITMGLERSASELHVLAKAARLAECTLDDTIAMAERPSDSRPWDLPGIAIWWMVVDGFGSLVLLDSTFRASQTSTLQGLLYLPAPGPAAVMRGCTSTNVRLESKAESHSLGVVSSTFEPPLPPVAMVQAPNCGIRFLNEYLCDPRAWCATGISGGVQCTCNASGLKESSELLPDGQRCQQETRAELQILAQEGLDVTIYKPNDRSTRLTLLVHALGESTFDIAYSVSMNRVRGMSSAPTAEAISSRTWPQDNESASSHQAEGRLVLDGLHLVWDAGQVPVSEVIQLGDATFSASRQYSFGLFLNCSDAEHCAADGDTFETVLGIVGQASMRITTHVISVISCEQSTAWVQSDFQSVPASTPFSIFLLARDVDGIAIEENMLKIDVTFGNTNITLSWIRGSNKYRADISGELTNQPGIYELLLSVHGWHSAKARAERCEILRRTITVTSDLTQTIVAGCLASVFAVSLVVLAWVVYKNKARAKQVLVSMAKFELLLVVEICLETWGLSPWRAISSHPPCPRRAHTAHTSKHTKHHHHRRLLPY